MLDCVLRQQFNSAFGRTQIGVPEHLLLLTCPPALRNHRKRKQRTIWASQISSASKTKCEISRRKGKTQRDKSLLNYFNKVLLTAERALTPWVLEKGEG